VGACTAALVCAMLLVVGCASSDGGQAGALNQPPPTSGHTPPVNTPPVSTPQIVDPVAPPFTPVMRNGVAPRPSIRADRVPFTKPARYPDHVTLRILSIDQDVTSGHGPGEIPGRPLTTMRIRFANGSTKPVNLNEVVVTVVYGADRRLAAPVYQDNAADFHSTIAPGGSTLATYAFSVPTSDLGNVTMTVDFDELHAAATFVGAAK
jgi:hypothetical protein